MATRPGHSLVQLRVPDDAPVVAFKGDDAPLMRIPLVEGADVTVKADFQRRCRFRHRGQHIDAVVPDDG